MIDYSLLFQGGPAPLAQGIEIFKADRQQAFNNQLLQDQNARAEQQAQQQVAQEQRAASTFDLKLQELARTRQQDHVTQTARQVSSLLANGDTNSAMQVLKKSLLDAQSIPELGELADDYAQYGERLLAGDVATVKNQADALISAFTDQTKRGYTFGSDVRYKDANGNIWTATQRQDPNKGTVETVYTPVTPGISGQPVGQLQQIQTSTGLTATEKPEQIASEEAARTQAKLTEESRAEIKTNVRKQRDDAAKTLVEVRDIKAAIEDVSQGRLALARQKFGGVIPGLRDADAELAQSMFTQFILARKDQLLGGGILSDADIALLQSIGPQLGNSAEGNQKILSMFEKASEATIRNAKLFEAFVAGGGNPENFVPESVLSVGMDNPSPTPVPGTGAGRTPAQPSVDDLLKMYGGQ